jgi:hypothetical protein
MADLRFVIPRGIKTVRESGEEASERAAQRATGSALGLPGVRGGNLAPGAAPAGAAAGNTLVNPGSGVQYFTVDVSAVDGANEVN